MSILANLAGVTLNCAWPIAKPHWAHDNPDLAHAQVGVSGSKAWLGQKPIQCAMAAQMTAPLSLRGASTKFKCHLKYLKESLI